MGKKLADDIAVTNAEYEKLKSDRPDDAAPRESPRRLAPGIRGLRRPELECWTTDELRTAAATLRIAGAGTLERTALIDALLVAESE